MKFSSPNPVWLRLAMESLLIIGALQIFLFLSRKNAALWLEQGFVLAIWLLYLYTYRHTYYIIFNEDHTARVRFYKKFRIIEMEFKFDQVELVYQKGFRGRDQYLLFSSQGKEQYKLNYNDGLEDIDGLYAFVKNQLDKN